MVLLLSLYLDATLHVGGIEEKEEEVILLMSDANTKAPSYRSFDCDIDFKSLQLLILQHSWLVAPCSIHTKTA